MASFKVTHANFIFSRFALFYPVLLGDTPAAMFFSETVNLIEMR